MTRGENVSEVLAMAAPVRIGGEIYGVVVAGPIGRMESKQTEIEDALTTACTRISGDFG